MKQAIRFCGSVAFSLLLTGCAATRYEEYGPPLNSKTGSRAAPPAAPASTQQQAADSLAVRLTRLEGDLQERFSAQDSVTEELATRLASLGEQVATLRKEVQALDAQSRPDTAQAAAAQKALPFDVNRTYEQGLMAYNARHYSEAIEAFQRILVQTPHGDLADNAQYWIGECRYAQGKYQVALEAFQKVFTYSKTEKDDDAQLKIGLCYLQMGNDQSALVEFKRLVVDYPSSEYVARAQALIRKIRARMGNGP